MPWSPWKFPNRGKGTNESEESEGEKLSRPSREELESINLTDEALLSLPPAELIKLNERLHALRESVRGALTPMSEQIRELWDMPYNQVLARVQFLSPHQRELIVQRLDLDDFIGQLEKRIKGELKEHWEPVFAEIRDRRNTPFGDAGPFYTNYWRDKGVDIENPTQKDVDRFFELESFHPLSISFEKWLRVEKEEGADARIADAFVRVAKRYEEPDDSVPEGKRVTTSEEKRENISKLREAVTA